MFSTPDANINIKLNCYSQLCENIIEDSENLLAFYAKYLFILLIIAFTLTN